MPYADHIPTISRHKPSGQAVVRLNGKDLYLGTHGSAAAKAEYNRAIGEWLAAGRQLPTSPNSPLAISEILLSYKRHVEEYYRLPNGKPTTEVVAIKYALKPLRKMYGTTEAANFGPLKLTALRDSMIATGGTRNGINRNILRVKAFFKWAVSKEMLPASISHALSTVRGLAPGRSDAKENEPVKPAPQACIDAALVKMPSVVAAMVRMQLLTGARPGEIAQMRLIDLNAGGTVWKYTPAHHKTAHHRHDRTIWIGPKAQAILKPFLNADTTAYLFAPRAAVEERRAKAAAARKTPLSCGNRAGTNRQTKPKRTAGNFYTTTAYNRAIRRACDAAEVPYFHAHQLRHNAATSLREQFGVDVARTILGHHTLAATMVYAEADHKKAEAVISKVG